MTAQVGCDDMEMAPQLERDPVPVAAMVAPAVHQDRERLIRIPPIHVMQLETLRIKIIRSGADYIGYDLRHQISCLRCNRPPALTALRYKVACTSSSAARRRLTM